MRVDQIAVEAQADLLSTGKPYNYELFKDAKRLLIARVIRVLAGMGIFKEVGHELFVPAPLAGEYLTGSPLTAGVIYVCVDKFFASSTPVAELPI